MSRDKFALTIALLLLAPSANAQYSATCIGEEEDKKLSSGKLDDDYVVETVRRCNGGVNAKLKMAQAKEIRASAKRNIPDLGFYYEISRLPIATPYRMDKTEMHSIGLRAIFPLGGIRKAYEDAEKAGAKVLEEEAQKEWVDIATQVRMALTWLRMLKKMLEVLDEQIETLSKVEAISIRGYEANQGNLAVVLQLRAQIKGLKSEKKKREEEMTRYRAFINGALQRKPEAIVEPKMISFDPEFFARLSPGRLFQKAMANNKEIRWLEARIEEAKRLVKAKKKERDLVELEAKASYNVALEMPDSLRVMLMINLPWLNPARWKEVRAQTTGVLALENELENKKAVLMAEIQSVITCCSKMFDAWKAVGVAIDELSKAFDLARSIYSAGDKAISLQEVIMIHRDYLEKRMELIGIEAEIEMKLQYLWGLLGGGIYE
jgi:outer membrane protein TolC